MKQVIGLAALMALACGDLPDAASLEQELGQLKEPHYNFSYNTPDARRLGTQAHDAPSPPGSPGHQCTAGQQAGVNCFVTIPDPVLSGDGLKWYQIRVGPGFTANQKALIDGEMPTIANQLTNDSFVPQSGNYVEFSFVTSGTPEINIVPANYPTPPVTRDINAYAKAQFGGLSAALTESPATNGTWKTASVCTIGIDLPDLGSVGIQALEEFGEPFPSLQSVVRQALTNKILACVGLGKRSWPKATNAMPYTHQFLTRDVYNNSNYFKPEERCVLYYSCLHNSSSSCGGTAAMQFFTIPSGTDCGT